jgi:DNA-binding Lrp family transcriptional regulator
MTTKNSDKENPPEQPCMDNEIETDIYELNEIDRKILRYIQLDGRASFRKIADELSIGVSTVSKHIEDLQKNDVIKDFIAVVNCCKIGYQEMILMFIKINSTVGIQETLCNLENIEEINAIYQVSGAQPIFCIAKCVEKNDQIKLLERVKRIKGIEEITTHVILQRVKEDMRVIIPE